MKTEKRERLSGLDEIKGARITLNNLEQLVRRSTGEITKDKLVFQIMLMREELSRLEDYELEKMYDDEMNQHRDYVEWWVNNYMTCSHAPCHKCHHLNNGCYGPTDEMVEKIKELWEARVSDV